MTEEEHRNFVRLTEQAADIIQETVPGVMHGSPSRAGWWSAVEDLRLAAERLQTACADVLDKR